MKYFALIDLGKGLVSHPLGECKDFDEASAALDAMGQVEGFSWILSEQEQRALVASILGMPMSHLECCCVCGDKPYRLYVVCKKHKKDEH